MLLGRQWLGVEYEFSPRPAPEIEAGWRPALREVSLFFLFHAVLCLLHRPIRSISMPFFSLMSSVVLGLESILSLDLEYFFNNEFIGFFRVQSIITYYYVYATPLLLLAFFGNLFLSHRALYYKVRNEWVAHLTFLFALNVVVPLFPLHYLTACHSGGARNFTNPFALFGPSVMSPYYPFLFTNSIPLLLALMATDVARGMGRRIWPLLFAHALLIGFTTLVTASASIVSQLLVIALGALGDSIYRYLKRL